jgi:fimbrial isopeptide formation D2 family protein
MKHVKKLLAVVLSAALAMAMCVTAFAGDVVTPEQPYIQITNNANENTYTVYQVMSATMTQGEDEATYQYQVVAPFNSFFGSTEKYNIVNDQIVRNSDGKVFGNPAVNSEYASDTRTTNVKDSATKSDTAALAKDLADFVRKQESNINLAITDTEKHNVDLGLYLIVETDSGSANETAESTTKEVASKPMLLDLTQDAKGEIAPKNDQTTLTKKIVEDDARLDANTAGIGDTVTYEITSNLPSYEANIEKNSLSFVLTDNLYDGLTFNTDSLSVVEGGLVGKEATASEPAEYDFTYTFSGQKLTINFEKESLYQKQGTEFKIQYSAVLNEKARVNSTLANPNEVTLEYANNPGQEGTSETKTLKDEVKTYTYAINIDKVDGHDNSGLDKAEFTLVDTDGNKGIKFVEVSEGHYRVATEEEKTTGKDTDGNTVTVVDKITSKNGGHAVIEGLDEGTYTLTETKAPDEFTKLSESITIVITETKDDNGNSTGEATITANGGGDATVVDDQGNPTGMIESDENGSIKMIVLVKNFKGVTMPETGSRTAMYCMIGGAAVIVLGAGYYLMGARRNKKEQ